MSGTYITTPNQKGIPRIVVIGGGTGSFTLLSGLKNHSSHLTALVSMADDGGSTGLLRDELGVLPPGDVRQCLVALSRTPRMRELFNYRFDNGSLAGHAFGNLFLTALEKMTGSFGEAVEEAGRILDISGRVEPITLDKIRLVIETSNGDITKGEFNGSQCNFHGHPHPQVRLEPAATINPRAREAICEADMIVIAPGGLYTSLAPALVVAGVSEAIRESKAKKIYVCNLVTKPGQTDGFSVSDYVSEIERFLDGGRLDYVIYNNRPPSEKLLKKYALDGEYPVKWDENDFMGKHYQARGFDLIVKRILSANESDPIKDVRSFYSS